MKYFTVKQTSWHIVRADNERDALRDYHCPIHAIQSTGSAYVEGEPVEARDIWDAKNQFEVKK